MDHWPMPKQATDSTMQAPKKSQMKASHRLRLSAPNRARWASFTYCRAGRHGTAQARRKVQARARGSMARGCLTPPKHG